jgi:hypothetical protein
LQAKVLRNSISAVHKAFSLGLLIAHLEGAEESLNPVKRAKALRAYELWQRFLNEYAECRGDAAWGSNQCPLAQMDLMIPFK